MRIFRKQAVRIVLLTCSTLAGTAVLAAPSHHISLPAQSLATSLQSVGAATGVSIAFSPATVEGKEAPPLNGNYEAREALHYLIRGNGLQLEETPGSTYVIKRVQPVSVQLVDNRFRPAAYHSASQPASPETASPQPSETSTGIQDIIVTAQKRTQNIQDVPIAISAFSSSYLQSRNITSITSISGIAPNVRIGTTVANPTTTVISIRGEAQTNPQIYFEPSVGMYLDGVYIGKSQGSLFDVADIERIEILRGPQGTLYGRNALAGAINIVTAKPDGELGGKVDISYGNYNYLNAKATLNTPSIGIFSAKISGMMKRRDGIFKVAGNRYTDDAQSLNSKSGMLQLRASPSDDFVLDYSLDISVTDTQNGAPQAILGTGPLVPYLKPRKRQRTLSFDSPNYVYAKNIGNSLTASLDIAENTQLKSITSIRTLRYRDASDADGTPLDFALYSRKVKYKQFSQEIQLVGSTGNLNYTMGGYYFKDSADNDNPQSYFFGAFATDGGYGFDSRSFAGYLQLEYTLNHNLTVTAGLRYTSEKKDVTRSLVQHTPSGDITVIDLEKGDVPAATFKKFTPAATLSYTLSSNVNAYIRYARGFRSGGFNATANTAADVRHIFQPQIQDTYEIGVKSTLFDNRMTINLAAFQNNTKDLQLSVFVPGLSASSILVNAGKSRTKGIEAEISYHALRDVSLHTNIGYLSSRFIEYIDNGINVSNNRSFPYAPEWTISSRADISLASTDIGNLKLLPEVNFMSSYYTSASPIQPTSVQDLPASYTKASSSTLINARIILDDIPIKTKFASLSLWMDNILDQKNPNFYINYGASFNSLVAAYYPNPRTFGISASIKF